MKYHTIKEFNIVKCKSSFCVDLGWIGILSIDIDHWHFAVHVKRQLPIRMKRGSVDPRGINNQHFAIHMKRWSPIHVKRQLPIVDLGGGSTINMERIDSEHFTVHMNCQLLIVYPGEGVWDLCIPTISSKIAAKTLGFDWWLWVMVYFLARIQTTIIAADMPPTKDKDKALRIELYCLTLGGY